MVRRPRPEATHGGVGSSRLLLYVESCFCCGGLIDRLTPWMVGLHWGDERLGRDEVPVQNVATVSKWCHGCYQKLVEDGRLDVFRSDLEMQFTQIVGEGRMGVRHDKTIAAWATRKVRGG